MQQRELGKGGPKVGALGLGCMSFGGFYGPTDEAESHATLARAWEHGITHLDTSNAYGPGTSETVIGTFLKGHPHAFSIATKAGITRNPDKPFDNAPDYLRACLEDSLKRLGVDHIDLYYVHRREAARPVEEVMETMARFVEEGKIGGIGLSEVSPATLERAAAVHPVRAVQSEYSLWTRLPDLGLVQRCASLGAALVAFSPLGRGVFTETLPDLPSLSDKDFRRNNPRFDEPNWSYNRKAAERFQAFARERGIDTGALALAWVLKRAPHIIAIPGTRSAAHLDQWVPGGDIALTDADMAQIEAILPVGFAHGDRYAAANIGPERYC